MKEDLVGEDKEVTLEQLEKSLSKKLKKFNIKFTDIISVENELINKFPEQYEIYKVVFNITKFKYSEELVEIMIKHKNNKEFYKICWIFAHINHIKEMTNGLEII